MADKDGILRHALLYLDAPDGEKIYSMAARAALEFDGGITLPETGSIGQFAVTYYGGPGSFPRCRDLMQVGMTVVTMRLPTPDTETSSRYFMPFLRTKTHCIFSEKDGLRINRDLRLTRGILVGMRSKI